MIVAQARCMMTPKTKLIIIIIMAELNLHKTILRVLSVTTSSSVVVPVVLHSYPLCQQAVCVCVCVWGGGG